MLHSIYPPDKDDRISTQLSIRANNASILNFAWNGWFSISTAEYHAFLVGLLQRSRTLFPTLMFAAWFMLKQMQHPWCKIGFIRSEPLQPRNIRSNFQVWDLTSLICVKFSVTDILCICWIECQNLNLGISSVIVRPYALHCKTRGLLIFCYHLFALLLVRAAKALPVAVSLPVLCEGEFEGAAMFQCMILNISLSLNTVRW